MRKIDIEMLTPREAKAVDDSFDREGLASRFRDIMLGAFFAVGIVLLMVALGATRGVITAAFAVFVAITVFEKMTYVRAQLEERSAIRKLVHRIEALEGVPSTPDNAKPSELAVKDKAA